MFVSVFSPYAIWGLLILRVAVGVVFLMHGIAKINPNGPTKGPSGFIGWLKSIGVPLAPVAGWGVITLETLGSILLIVGAFPRVIGLLLALNMLVAILMVKRKDGFTNAKGNGWEFEFVLLVAALAIVFIGAGQLVFDPFPGW
jgi:putative oxidoreductase